MSGFLVITLVFSAAHALFLAVIVFFLSRNTQDELAQISWQSAGYGCLIVLALLSVDLLADMFTLRQWSFWQIEQTAQQALSRVVVVHLTLIVGMFGIAVTGASSALFGVFVTLKSLAALSFALPQWDPTRPPKWLSRLMNRVPNVHPGQRFEDYWIKDRTEEHARRERNEQPWTGSR